MQTLDNVILFLIEQASKAAKRHSQRVFDEKKLGITVDQWVLLKIIQENESSSQKELAEISYRDGASITRSLKLLDNMGFIKRTPTPEDKRQYNISLSKKGEDFVEMNMDMVKSHRKKSVKGLSKGDLQELKRMLVQIRKNME